MKCTAIIPCFNEETNILGALTSVTWADEIIVVDSFSTDRTIEIVNTFKKAKFVQHEYINSASQKNWIIPQAQNSWIFLLDADERATPGLIEEIKGIDLDSSGHIAYDITRQNYFFGKKLKHIWKSDSVIRLFHKDHCKYQELDVHAEIITDGSIGKLKKKIDHHSFKSISHYLNKIRRYAKWSATDYSERTGRLSPFHFVIKPFFRFLKHYFIQGGLWDGQAGFLISSIQAWGVFLRYIYIWEDRNKK